MKVKSVSLRITGEEFEALKRLAKRDVRTVSSWIRAKIVSEAHKAGIGIGSGDLEPNSPPTETEAN